MNFNFTIETERFEHRIVGANFINPCCFGEDFIGWLRQQLAFRLPSSFHLSDPIQEDYGWGIWIRPGRDTFWICLSCTEPQSTPAQWIVLGNHDFGLNLFRRLFHRPSTPNFAEIYSAIEGALLPDQSIRILERQCA